VKAKKRPQPAVADPTDDPALKLGGMALSNGLIVVSALNWAAAIREDDGSISVASGKKSLLPGTGERALGKSGQEGVPLVRGLGRLAESIVVLGSVKKRLPGARLPFDSGRVAGALMASAVGSTAVRVLAPRSALVQEAGTALAAFIPAMVVIKDSPASGYHGAEHKVIGAREEALRAARSGSAAGEAAVGAAGDASARDLAGDAVAAPKEHDRCGTNLVGPFLLASVLANVLARDKHGRRTPLRSAVAGATSLGLALEGLRWADRHSDSAVARLMMLPGKAIQKGVTTSEPTPEHSRATGGGSEGSGRATEAGGRRELRVQAVRRGSSLGVDLDQGRRRR